MKSGIPLKMIRHAKKEKNTTDNEEESQPIDTDPELTQMTELVDQDIKTVLHMLKKPEERLNMLNRDMEHLKKI